MAMHWGGVSAHCQVESGEWKGGEEGPKMGGEGREEYLKNKEEERKAGYEAS